MAFISSWFLFITEHLFYCVVAQQLVIHCGCLSCFKNIFVIDGHLGKSCS